jgi:hypothetical protein
LDVDAFIVTQKPGSSNTVPPTYRDLRLNPGTWKVFNCFVVRARDSIDNISTDSNTACVPHFALPVSSPAPVRQ